jgi:serine/threonine protein kinase
MLEQLAHYKILEQIGSGRLGEVFRARDLRLGRTVAIRVIPADLADDPVWRAVFLRDAYAAARLSHPNIATLYDVNDGVQNADSAAQPALVFLAFEFVPGEALSKMIGGQPLNPRRAMQFALQVANALAEAHALGIVHGAIEPGNVFVTPRGHAKVLDFGLAAWTENGRQRRPAPRDAYRSPEQRRGEPPDPRSDIFALGVMLLEMLTGSSEIPPPSTIELKLPRALAPILSRALEKDPDARFQSAAILAAQLRACE